MTNKNTKIRQKVEKLISQLFRGACSSQVAMETRCKEEAYNEVLAILDSLQEEPVSEDLEEAAKNHAYSCHTSKATGERIAACIYDFKAGAKWQKTKDESTTEDLGEYIDKLSKQFPEVSFAKLSRIAVRVSRWQKEQDQETIELAEDHAMLAGMDMMKEEMMEKAIDAELCSDGMLTPLISVNDKEKISDIKFGDRVKIVLFKK